jgi:hypothetical protein
MMMRTIQKASERMGAAAIGLLGLWIGFSGGCAESGPRVFSAQRYRADLGCVEGYAALGLVEAEDVGAFCEPVCLSQNEELFVSTVCPPYPALASLEPPETLDCAAALVAPSCDELADAAPTPAEPTDAAAP